MTEQEVFSRVHGIAEGDQEELAKLSREIAAECREPARTILETWRGRPRCGEACCAFVCRHLEELAVGEMLDAAGPANAAMRVQLMEMAVERYLVLREYLLTILKPMLDQIDSVQLGTSMRTCDGAYLLARRLVPVHTEEAEKFTEPGAFLALDNRVKDREITEWKLSETWEKVFTVKTSGS